MTTRTPAPAPTGELTMTIGGGYTVEPGTYEATLIALEDFQYDDGEGNKTLRRWTFGLESEVDPEGKPITIDGVSSTATGPKSKAFGWLAALLGRPPVTGETFTPSMLVGRGCMVTVELNAEGYSKVAAVVPQPRRGRVAAAPTAVEETAEFAGAPVTPAAEPAELPF